MTPGRFRYAVTAAGTCLLVVAAAPACALDRAGLLSPTATSSGPASGGSGGASNTGGTGGGGGQATFEWVADAPQRDGTLALPTWLTFRSSSSNKTAQTSASTIRTGFGVDAPRGRNVGRGWGLCVEPARTNDALNASSWGGSGWSAGFMQVTTGVADPAGGQAAAEFSSPGTPGGTFSDYQNVTGMVSSTWAKGVSGGPPYSYFRGTGITSIDESEWHRYVVVLQGSQDLTLDVALETRMYGPYPAINVATVTAVFGLQVEAGARYASSYIPTTGSPVTRQAERLFIHDAPERFPSGFFDVELSFAPHYASDQLFPGDEHDLVYFGSQNRVFVRHSGGGTSVCMTVADEERCSGVLTWTAESVLTMRATHSSAGRTLLVDGSDQGAVTVEAPASSPLVVPRMVDILGNGQPGAQQGADLRRIALHAVQ